MKMMNTVRHRLAILLLALLAFVCVSTTHAAENTRPNILFIFSDDHAYHGVSAFGVTWRQCAPSSSVRKTRPSSVPIHSASAFNGEGAMV